MSRREIQMSGSRIQGGDDHVNDWISDAAQRLSRSALVNSFYKLSASLGMGQDSLVQRLAGLVFLIRGECRSGVRHASFAGSLDGRLRIRHLCRCLTWVLLLGSSVDLGLASAAQRLIPEYVQQQKLACLRGFLSVSRWLSMVLRPSSRDAVLPWSSFWSLGSTRP